MAFGDYPAEYNPKVHGPYDPARFYGKRKLVTMLVRDVFKIYQTLHNRDHTPDLEFHYSYSTHCYGAL